MINTNLKIEYLDNEKICNEINAKVTFLGRFCFARFQPPGM